MEGCEDIHHQAHMMNRARIVLAIAFPTEEDGVSGFSLRVWDFPTPHNHLSVY